MNVLPDHASLNLETSVAFSDVDRDNVLHLRGLLKLLQEAAIAHANLFDTGANAMLERGESWVLNRLALGIARYPAYGEKLTLKTWSSGIRGFRGYRDFLLCDESGTPILRGSSLWLYFSTRTHAITRPPADLAERFPHQPDKVWCAELERLPFAAPAADAQAHTLSLRYSDFDANRHLNNTIYGDLAQAALARSGRAARPTLLQLRFDKGIEETCTEASVRLQDDASGHTLLAVLAGTQAAAVGRVGWGTVTL